MELHQIRYFLALSKRLNFTKAAEDCNVSQPALSRAIAQLEAELGGHLFRRERKLTHLTEFGRAILTPLRECYEANLNAKELARRFHAGGHAPLSIALSRSIDLALLTPMLAELGEAFPNIEIKMFRGTAEEITDRLKKGESEIAVSEPLSEFWDRIESKQLFEQEFGLLITRNHRLAKKNEIEIIDLSDAHLLGLPNSVLTETLQQRFREMGITSAIWHEVSLLDDIPGLVRANLGLGIWPSDRKYDGDLLVSHIRECPMSRCVQVYTVFGRQHSAAAKTFINLLRANDWSDGSPYRRTGEEAMS
ncbi:HTH-type transcriptional regulator GltC [Defluviimonas aquaemixtae]|uniref:HTH-type transcriptional regulator GltC n=1 Tax=Albidovulum aquaemixtae TaxID=1542388 RepID=A0A2R8B4H9_9RHOB|nr:LysR family transcriptional regulator [Defluviimonas aquaemixtae]SPH17514.1 HTH-type transcriptional regulator GltC [Defluviimonas aquaemixtae]